MVSAKKHGIECRILLIDNASTDETRDEAGKMVSDMFAHKRNEERWGFQRSVNFGVNDAWERGFDYALVCNNDILLHQEAIWRLVGRFSSPTYVDPETKEESGLAMVTCMDMRGQIEPQAFLQCNPNDVGQAPEAPHPNFSAFMLSKEAWETVGEMDEVFAPAYFEDNDYHYRIKLAGMEAITYPPALFYHFASGTQREAKEREGGGAMVSNQQFEANRATYARKWGGLPGEEKFETPYNEPVSFTATKQSP